MLQAQAFPKIRVFRQTTRTLLGAEEGMAQMIFVLRGSGSVICGDDIHRTPAGKLFLSGSGNALLFHADTRAVCDILCISADVRSGFSGFSHSAPELWALMEKLYRKKRIFQWQFSDADAARLEMLSRLCADEMPDAQTRHFCSLAVFSCLAACIRSLNFLEDAQSGVASPVRQAIGLVERHYASPLTLPAVAAMVHVSPSCLSHAFPEKTGVSFSAYVHRVRMMHAEQMLLSTDEMVGTVALASGFSNTAYFVRRFREEKGLSPLQYRKAHRREGERA